MSRSRWLFKLVACVWISLIVLSVIVMVPPPSRALDSFHLGRTPMTDEIADWDRDVAPDGVGLPEGKGTTQEGAKVYAEYCAGCHGATGIEGPQSRLVGRGSLSGSHPLKTIGSYWPYATTVFDYIYRAMPYSAPQSLTPDQVYGLVAWLLFRNDIIQEGAILDAHTLVNVRMPNRNGFFPDPRPDVSRGLVPLEAGADLGDIEFPTSGSTEAQPYFHRGVLLLHNFEYEDAAEVFRQAQQQDPQFVMAYWGEAMTYNHPLWGEQDLDAARRVLQRLGPTETARQAKAPTKREQAYLLAVERLYGEGDKSVRDQAYKIAMGAVAVQNPRDLEARAFYALAILGATGGTRDAIQYLQAGALAESVFHENPRHPGGMHYLIHAYDDPQQAFRALPAARSYGTLASSAPHARHMPSHIFMALGMWQEVVQANELARNASEARLRRKGLGIGDRSYHTLYWLMYGYLQQGQDQEARRILDIVKSDRQNSGTPHVRNLYASMRATYTIESESWDVRGVENDRSELRFSSAVSDLLAIGLSGVHTNDLTTAKQALARMKERVQEEPGGNQDPALVLGTVSSMELEGMILLSEKQHEAGISLLEKAAALQDSLPYEYGPPFPVKPPHELLGEVLLDLGRTQEARTHFESVLLQTPKRAITLKGLARISR